MHAAARFTVVVLASLAPWLAAEARAQTGTITGVVVDRDTRQPIPSAQIMIPSIGRGVVAQANGRYLLRNVPPGTYEIEAQGIGYRTVSQTVQVADGQTVVVDFELPLSAIALDELVVAGSPAGVQRRRAIGTGIASIDVESKLRDAPVTRVQDLLQGREAGVMSMASSGTVGAAGPLILRGVTSLTQDNQPLIYIDGVRVDQSNVNMIGLGGQVVSRLSDLNPQDIERMEIIKGSAATALYGSEASSGVIQIFTKRGRPGETRYSLDTRIGANWIPKNLPKQHFDSKYPSANDLLKTGMHKEINASVRGGTETLGFYAGLSRVDTEGSFPNNHFERTAARLNVDLRPSEKLTATFSTAYSVTDAALPVNDNVTSGILTNIYLGNPVTRATETDPWGGAFFPVPMVLAREVEDEANRFTGSLTIDHRPFEFFSQRVTFGIERTHAQGRSYNPYWIEPNQPVRKGSRDVNTRNNHQFNIDYGAVLKLRHSPAYESDFSFGLQFFSRSDQRAFASGSEFASPGLRSLGATALASVNESDLSYKTGGFFGEYQLAARNLLFVKVGARVDGSSAFGEDFGLMVFPKASVSYVISDEDWFHVSGLDMLRLRFGYGTAGTQPGAFDHVRTYTNVIGLHGQPGIRAATYGNANLAPEVSHELEGGFDANLWDNRLSLTLTAYHQQTNDVLLEKTNPPSMGILSTQPVNAGKVRNRGFEVSAEYQLLRRAGIGWSVNASYSYNDNQVLSLAGEPFMILDRFGTRIVEGYPVAGKWERVTVGYDENGFAIASDTAVYIGPSIPPHTGNVGTTLNFGNVSLRATGQFAMGHYVNHHIKPYMAINRTGEAYWRVVAANGNDPDHIEVRKFIERHRIYGDFIEPADWFKVREVVAAYTLPSEWAARFGASSARVVVSGQNLLTITRYSGSDPEVSSTFGNGNNLSIGADYFTVPPSRQVMFGLSLQF
ncbi:MAG TPA: TonB-dependent receptor [Longimicrobiales bacterium]|nr:TonB-dependent receptor [Longimicrobiales bacterium]